MCHLLDLPTFLHFMVAGRKATTAKKPSNDAVPGTTENAYRTYSAVALPRYVKNVLGQYSLKKLYGTCYLIPCFVLTCKA